MSGERRARGEGRGWPARVVLALLASALLAGLLARLLRPDDIDRARPASSEATDVAARSPGVAIERVAAEAAPVADAASAGGEAAGERSRVVEGEAGAAGVESAAGWRLAITLDGAPWSGATLRLAELDDRAHETGHTLDVVADAAGAFTIDRRGRWRLVGGPGWPARWTVHSESASRTAGAAWGDRGKLVVGAGRWITEWEEGDVLVGLQDARERPRIDVHTPVRLAGRVVDATGVPVAGATLSRPPRPPGMPPATSASGGAFVVEAPWLGGAVELVASAPGLAPGALSRRFASRAAALEAAPFEVVLGHALVTAAGVVRDVDGAPMPGARVTASLPLPARGGGEALPWSAAVETDAGGRFELGLPGGAGEVGPWCARATLVAEHPAFLGAARWSGVVGPGATTCELVLSRASRLEGRVLDAQGAPLAGAVVEVRRERVLTRQDGRFVFERAPERAEVRLRHREHVRRALLASLPLAAPLEVRLDAGVRVEGVVEGGRRYGRRVHGCLVDDGAQPAWPARGEVVDRPPRDQLVTEVRLDGTFELGPFPAGATVEVWSGDFVRRVVQAGARDVRLREPPLGFRTVRLRVVDAASRQPLAVTAEYLHGEALLPAGEPIGSEAGGGGKRGTSADAGRAPSIEVPVAVRDLRVRTSIHRERELHLPEGGEPVDLGEVPLEAGGALALRVRWPRAAVHGLTARWRDPDGRERAAWARPDPRPGGAWRLDGLAPGPTRVVVTASTDGAPLEVALDAVVRAGETVELEVDLDLAR